MSSDATRKANGSTLAARTQAMAPPGKTPARPQVQNPTPSTMRGATYNCEIGRNPQAVANFVESFAKQKNLDFIQLQEISGYHKQLGNIPGYHLVTFPKSKDHGETGILVRNGIDTKDKASVQSTVGWTNVHGKPAQPRAATTVQLAGWLHVASVHAPPGINWPQGTPGPAQGPAQRIKSYGSLMKKLLGFTQKTPGALLVGGDWNEGAATGGKYSPTWLAGQAGLKTHPDGGIDWEMSKKCGVTNVERGPTGGSDHHIVTFTVTQPKKK